VNLYPRSFASPTVSVVFLFKFVMCSHEIDKNVGRNGPRRASTFMGQLYSDIACSEGDIDWTRDRVPDADGAHRQKGCQCDEEGEVGCAGGRTQQGTDGAQVFGRVEELVWSAECESYSSSGWR
jgi:hypothetical protein